MIYAYSGMSKKTINETHTTTNGKPYTLNHNPKLVGSTNYVGKGASNANSQGWERNSNKFFSSLEKKNPDMFSRPNSARIKAKQAPKVDDRMVQHAPELKPYKGEELVHHHIGGDGQAVAEPKSVHPGYGGIHNEEKKAGITQRCEAFSNECEKMTRKQPQMKGKSVDEFHAQINRQSASQGQAGRPAAVRSQAGTAASNGTGQSRPNAVRSQDAKGNAASAARARTNSVRSQASAAKTSAKGTKTGQTR